MANTRRRTTAPRLGSLSTILLVLAVIPSTALVALWIVSTKQLADTLQERARQHTLGDRVGELSALVATRLQGERRLTAEALAHPRAARDRLATERQRTDGAVHLFLSRTEDVAEAPPEMREALTALRDELELLPHLRRSVDQASTTQAQAYGSYTGVIRSTLRFHEALGKVNDPELLRRTRPLTELLWAQEMIAREDAVLTRAWVTGRVSRADRSQLADHIGAQRYLLEVRIAPDLPEKYRGQLRSVTASSEWREKEALERAVLRAGSEGLRQQVHRSDRWDAVLDGVREPLQELQTHLGTDVGRASAESLGDLRDRVAVYSAIGLGAVVVVIVLTVRLTVTLRRRVLAMRDEAARLESDLPAVVDRLAAGEKVDVDAEAPEIDHGADELGQLGRTLNQARRRLLETTVREAEQQQAFQRLLQRLARRTQILIGLQLRKLDEMERRHEDPEVLEGLFDLDHLTARLRRYEENMVILGGGQPQRRWRRPVRMLNVLRAALGEVQDYRRVQIEVPEDLWLAGRAVGPVVHVLAELMENATAFSKPPSPVETRAALVPRGIVVEIEDRGLGMEPEEYERCNRMMSGQPLTDMLSRADDVRLGLFVVARLAAGLGLSVEFRPSVFGGTRVIVLIPAELVADGPDDDDRDRDDTAPRAGRGTGRVVREGPRTPAEGRVVRQPADGTPDEAARTRTPAAAGPPAALPTRRRGQAMRAALGGGPQRDDHPEPAPRRGDERDGGTAADGPSATGDGAPAPLPRRVRQASLAPELRRPPRRAAAQAAAPPASPERSGATLGAFQRQSRRMHGPRRPQRPDQGREQGPDQQSATGASTPDPS